MKYTGEVERVTKTVQNEYKLFFHKMRDVFGREYQPVILYTDKEFLTGDLVCVVGKMYSPYNPLRKLNVIHDIKKIWVKF